MQLNPRNAEINAQYPARKPTTLRLAGRWVRRVAVAVAASAACWVTGCLPIGIGGDIAMPSFFTCADTSPEAPPAMDIPGSYYGEFCSSGTAWASIEVEEQETVAIHLSGGGSCAASADLIDPDGIAVATIDTETAEDVEITLSPGRWLVAIDQDGGCDYSSFSFDIEPVDEPLDS